MRFSLLSALSTSNDVPAAASRPFSKNRDGFVVAEGAAAMVLEDYDRGVARGAESWASSRDAARVGFVPPHAVEPGGKADHRLHPQRARRCGRRPEDVDYINAHGTSTPENDKMEHLGVSTVFGERMKDIPISSIKSMIGHTLTAAGTIEAAASILTLQHQKLPPTINYTCPIQRSRSTWCRTSRAMPGSTGSCLVLRLRRSERVPGDDAGAGMTGKAIPNRVLVTGGGRGIGAAIVRTLAAAGHDVLFTYRTDERARRRWPAEVAGKSGRAIDIARLDLADKTAVDGVRRGARWRGTPSTASSTTPASPTTRCWRCSIRRRPKRPCRSISSRSRGWPRPSYAPMTSATGGTDRRHRLDRCTPRQQRQRRVRRHEGRA